MSDDNSPKTRLENLISLYRGGKVSAEHFCAAFEQVYNLELDKTTLTETEAKAFEYVFNKVVWYSPFAEEREQIPNYLGEEDISKAVEVAVQMLGGGAEEK